VRKDLPARHSLKHRRGQLDFAQKHALATLEAAPRRGRGGNTALAAVEKVCGRNLPAGKEFIKPGLPRCGLSH
jgi:hypothetical protein